VKLRILGQNGSRQNGTDRMVWTKWYGQDGTCTCKYKTVPIKSPVPFEFGARKLGALPAGRPAPASAETGQTCPVSLRVCSMVKLKQGDADCPW